MVVELMLAVAFPRKPSDFLAVAEDRLLDFFTIDAGITDTFDIGGVIVTL